ncbi:MAG: rhodanese-like domain-containing protein [Deferribacteres bacterium]|nr:rhodanese-like domain-containing protein [candidate division KSB1 bacterium]MCB9503582.1 rhodanese-like domain-containing protein [Deferribacteres bacterium]
MHRILKYGLPFFLITQLISCSSDEVKYQPSNNSDEIKVTAGVAKTDPWGFPLITQQEIMRKINAKEEVFILDVRSEGEFQQGHIPGAVNIPIGAIKARLAELEKYKNKEITAICYSGGRTVATLRMLKSIGFTNLKHIEGDMQAWYSAKLPLD